MPVYDDWDCVRVLLDRLNRVLGGTILKADILLVDDSSPHEAGPGIVGKRALEGFQSIRSLEVLRLRCNLGHQRAIALGLCHLLRRKASSPVVVMDADGEDRPEDVPVLWEAFMKSGGRDVLFAARMKRMEGALFRLGYQAYRLFHWLLTGVAVRVGNFSVCPWHVVQQLTVKPELWNHYAACIYHSNIRYSTLPLDRGSRIAGQSRMRFVALAVHGLAAISVFSDRVAVRMLCGITLAAAGLCVGIAVRAVSYPSDEPLALMGGLLLITGQTFLLILAIALHTLARRSSPQIIPEQLYPFYVLDPVPDRLNA